MLGNVNKWLTGRFWKKPGVGAGSLLSTCTVFFLTSSPLSRNPIQSHGCPSLWRKISPRGGGRSIVMVGTSFIQQKQDEAGMRNQTQNSSWQNIWRGAGGQRQQHGLWRVTNGRGCQSAKGFPVFSGLFSEASSFHPVITQVLTKAQSWEMRLLCLVLQVIGIFIGRCLLSWANILWSVFEWMAQKTKERDV